ncbi:MAG: FprA family A-type flavoprotein [Clostridium sp.]|nr:FprA family A-type flavoprotein [Clostridium sp.]
MKGKYNDSADYVDFNFTSDLPTQMPNEIPFYLNSFVYDSSSGTLLKNTSFHVNSNIDQIYSFGKYTFQYLEHKTVVDTVFLFSGTNFVAAYPNAKIVGNAKTFAMIADFFDITIPEENKVTVANCESLSLGAHQLTFVFAPMVHWPEVMVTYDAKDKVLFSADGFGKFGALDVEEEWDCEARRYYIGIVGKYGAQVQALLKKAAALDIAIICPLHGPVLKDNLAHYINLYDIWSSYRAESEGVMIAYTSVYGHTKAAAELLNDKLNEFGCKKVILCDLARCDMAEAVEDAFRYGKLVLATTTYNADIFPFMRTFIEHLTERNYQNRTVGFIENGAWAPMAAKVMRAMLEKSKDITYLPTTVTIKSALKSASIAQIEQMAKELM